MKSNCLIEAIIMWIRNPKIKLYLWVNHKKKFHGIHIYWKKDGKYYHHTVPNPDNLLNLFEYIWHEGTIQELKGII
jgi:hypothetical protein